MADPASTADVRAIVAAAPRYAAATFALRTTDWERALLACDFTSHDRPALVTALLSAFLCGPDGETIEPIELWNLPVSTRHLALVRIAAALEKKDSLLLQLRCENTDCQEWLEVPLSITDLVKLHDEHVARETLDVTSVQEPLSLRRPTGDDLRRWRTAETADDEASRHQTMLQDLIVSGRAPKDFSPLADALETFDPLLVFTLTAICPACNQSTNHQIDLETKALKRLQARQNRLMREIHQLAQSYGWNEEEILAVPTARRARYLELVDDAHTP